LGWYRLLFSALLGAGLATLGATHACAQSSPVMLELEGDFAQPLNAPARDRFLQGGGLSAGALFAPSSFIVPSLRVRAIVLGDAPAPQDPEIVDPGIGTLYMATAGARLRTDGFGQSAHEPEATGFFLEIDLGVALTGPLVRPVFEGALGFLWDAGATDAGHVDIGPVARFVHVLQTEESGIDANSTFLLTLGLQIVLFDAAPTPPSEQRLIQTRIAPHHRRIEGNDADADGIDDSDDACPRDAEDLDGVRDLDGCPDIDDDNDGIPDTSDECPREAEDADGFRDDDGCPELDNDGDSYIDTSDVCPNEPETQNGVDDNDGCPDGAPVEETVEAPARQEEVTP
jgi:hypothetical protein